MARSSRKKNTLSVDFTDVDLEGGGSFRIPEGDYAMKVKSVEQGVSKNDNDQLEWKFVGTEGKAKGKVFYFYTTLTPDSLWKLGQTLKGLGMEVPNSAMDLDLEELVDLECIGVVIDDEWDGKKKSKLSEVYAEDDREEDKGGKEQPQKNNGKRREVEKIDDSEVNAMSEDELGDLIKKHDLDVELRDHKTLRRKANAVVEALDEKGLLA